LQDTDGQIIQDVQAGKVRRFAVLIERHQDRAMTLALRIIRNREEAEELVQDGFLRAFRSLHQFRGDATFGTWFYRILYNLCMTRIARRRETPEPIDLQDESVLAQTDPQTHEPTIQEDLESDEARQMVQSELDRLPGNLRITLTFFYVQGMSYEEIAAVMEVPLGTVKTCLFRGRRLLKQRVLGRMKEEYAQ
jgi:RNA polymerase sigma-70 factor (ECF subfamily)